MSARGRIALPAGASGARGFTLLEVIVALAILSFAVVASIQGFAQGLRLLRLAGDHQQAILLADQKAREVVTPTEGRDEGADGAFTWERTTKLLEAPEPAVSGAAPRLQVFEIDVRVRWDEHRQVEVATLRTLTPTLQATPAPGAPAPTLLTPPAATRPTTPPATSRFGRR